MFHGSYLKRDVEFLVKVVDIDFTEVQKKEKLIQSGKAHYSEMLSQEYEPTSDYLEMFYKSYEVNKKRFANNILTLSHHLSLKKEIVIISLLRAGTPIGVLVKRTLNSYFNQEVKHYSISIIRDREIDKIALKHIIERYPHSEFIFIDGWTGKGVINQELKRFIHLFNQENNTKISDKLYVVSDIAYVANFSVTNEDYLIPSSALNSTISGLVSRSILNDTLVKEGEFHACKYYKEYAKNDLTLWFIDEVMSEIESLELIYKPLLLADFKKYEEVNRYLKNIQIKFEIKTMNYIKPGIGETTRVLLRRVPYCIFVQDIKDKRVEHLLLLAKEKKVKVVEDNSLPYSALAIIKDVL